jgi:hypothetical protein
VDDVQLVARRHLVDIGVEITQDVLFGGIAPQPQK